MNIWSDSIGYGATKNSDLFVSGASPLRPLAYPRALSQLVFLAELEKRGRMGCAHFIRPLLLGARVAPGSVSPTAWRPNAERRTPNAERRTPNDEIAVQSLQFNRFRRLTHESGSHDARIESRAVR